MVTLLDSAQMYATACNPINNLQSLFAFIFMGSLPNLFNLYHNYDVTKDHFQATLYDTQDTFDFIVVGAGSAGAVVANRLSEGHTVLLLEAGGEPSPILEIPSLFFTAQTNPHSDWGLYTVPQKHSFFSTPNRKGRYIRGLGLGGSSSINAMVYLRGHPNDYDGWANQTGDPRWSYENVLPFFKKQEDYHGQWENAEWHSQGGDIKISESRYSRLANEFVQAGVEMGYEETDLNGRFTNGFMKTVFNQDEGRRFGTLNAFLEPARKRKNLSIYKFARAHKILFKGSNNLAYGVEYERHGRKKTAFANNEVIISAGAAMTPHLLMHSGIGPRAHLESHKIPVIGDLPVGQNIQDHVGTTIGPFVMENPKLSNSDPEFNYELYQYNGTGLLSSVSTTASAFLVSWYKNKELDWPDIQLITLEIGEINDDVAKSLATTFTVSESALKKYFEPVEGKEGFYITVLVARPKQRGDIKLASSNSDDLPLLDPKCLSAPEDMKLLIEGAQRAVALVENTTTFQALKTHLSPVPFPGCENVKIRSDAYWECYYRHFTLMGLHISGSCPMGKLNSKEAVVDSELRVFGTQGLRVIDASIMPTISSGNTNAPTMMIGEMGSNFIKSKWSFGKVQLH